MDRPSSRAGFRPRAQALRALPPASGRESGFSCLPIGSTVVPFGVHYLEPYKVTPKRNYYGAYASSSDSLSGP